MKHILRLGVQAGLTRLQLGRWARSVGTSAAAVPPPPPPPPPSAAAGGPYSSADSSSSSSTTSARRYSNRLFLRQTVGVHAGEAAAPSALAVRLVRNPPRRFGGSGPTYSLDVLVGKSRLPASASAPAGAGAGAGASPFSSGFEGFNGYRMNAENVATFILGLQYGGVTLSRSWPSPDDQNQVNQAYLKVASAAQGGESGQLEVQVGRQLVGQSSAEAFSVALSASEVLSLQRVLAELVPTLTGWDQALANVE